MKILRYLQFSHSPKGVSYANNKCNSKFTRNGCFIKGMPFLLKGVWRDDLIKQALRLSLHRKPKVCFIICE